MCLDRWIRLCAGQRLELVVSTAAKYLISTLPNRRTPMLLFELCVCFRDPLLHICRVRNVSRPTPAWHSMKIRALVGCLEFNMGPKMGFSWAASLALSCDGARNHPGIPES